MQWFNNLGRAAKVAVLAGGLIALYLLFFGAVVVIGRQMEPTPTIVAVVPTVTRAPASAARAATATSTQAPIPVLTDTATASPTNPSTNTPTLTRTPTPSRTPTSDSAATATEEARRLAAALAATLTAQPTTTPTRTASPTAEPQMSATPTVVQGTTTTAPESTSEALGTSVHPIKIPELPSRPSELAVYRESNLSGHITQNTLLTAENGPYVVDGYLTVDEGVILIIEAGTIVKVANNVVIGVRGSLRSEGVAGNPVVFTSLKDDSVGGDTNQDLNVTTPATGDWGQIYFSPESTDSFIIHTVIRYGGVHQGRGKHKGNTWYYARPGDYDVWTYQGSIRLEGASPTIRNTMISDGANYAIDADVYSFPVLQGNTFEANGGNGLRIRGGTMSRDHQTNYRWSNTDVVYVVTGNNYITVGPGVTLQIDPGVKVKMGTNSLIGVQGALKVLGTKEYPVTFTSLKDDSVAGDTNSDLNVTQPDPGDWGHIYFADTSVDEASIIEHAIIRYGGLHQGKGKHKGNTWYYGRPGDYDVWTYRGSIRLEGASPTIRNTMISDGANYAIDADVYSFPVLQGNTFEANGGNGLRIRTGTLSGTRPATYRWSNTDVVYVVADNNYITVGPGITLEIDPGVKIKMGANSLIGVQGALKVLGTKEQPVTFTSLKDDSVAGDTNSDLNVTQPGTGDWGHIYFADTSVDEASIIEHAIIRYGGLHQGKGKHKGNTWYYGRPGDYDIWTYRGSIRLEGASPTIRNTMISDGANYAIDADVYSFPVLQGNTFEANGGNGLRIRTGTLSGTRPATYRWSNTDVVYVVADNNYITIGPGMTLEIAPGVKIKMGANSLIGVQGTLKVLGAKEQPVTFTSLKDDSVAGDTNGDLDATQPSPGAWGHIYFADTSVDEVSIIDHAIIRYGGLHRGLGKHKGNSWYYARPGDYDIWTYHGSIRLDAASPTIRDTMIGYAETGLWLLNGADPTLESVEYRNVTGERVHKE